MFAYRHTEHAIFAYLDVVHFCLLTFRDFNIYLDAEVLHMVGPFRFWLLCKSPTICSHTLFDLSTYSENMRISISNSRAKRPIPDKLTALPADDPVFLSHSTQVPLDVNRTLLITAYSPHPRPTHPTRNLMTNRTGRNFLLSSLAFSLCLCYSKHAGYRVVM